MVSAIGQGSCDDGYGGTGPMAITLRHTGTNTSSPSFSLVRRLHQFGGGSYSVNYVFPAVQGGNTIEFKSSGTGVDSCLAISIQNASVLFIPG